MQRFRFLTHLSTQAAVAALNALIAARSASFFDEKTSDEFDAGEKFAEQSDLDGGPPGDRTRDTVIKSHVLYH